MSEIDPGSGIRWWQATFAALLLLARIAATPPSLLPRDWLCVVAAYWLYKSIKPRAESGAVVTTSLAAYLLGLYFIGQGPHTLASLGFR